MEDIMKKLNETELKTLLMVLGRKGKGSIPTHPQSMRLDLPPVDLKLDGPAMYLSWSRRIEAALVGMRLDGYLIGIKAEPASGSAEEDKWKTTQALLYTWLLNSMVPKVASSVDDIRKVEDIWAKLKMTYAGAENHMRVFQIQRDTEAVVQGDRSIQEYSMKLEQLWQDLDHFSPVSSCSDPGCKSREFNAQMRTMQFLAHMNPVFDQRRSVLLAQIKIPSLDEAISAMIQEESRMRLHSEPGGLPGARSALATLSSGMTGAHGETRRCYNCGEVGHLSKTCPKPPKEREAGGRGQFGGRGRGRGGRRGGRGGGYRAHLMVDPQVEEETGFTEEEYELFEMLKRKQIMTGDGGKKSMTDETSTSDSRGNFATFTHSATGEGDGPETWDWHVA